MPCPPAPAAFARAPTADPRLVVRILPGLSQDDPPDVMRGEETQIAGLLAREPDFDGIACLPGTHTKWAHVSAGEVVSFASYMTGELFGLLAATSVLRKTLAEDGWSGGLPLWPPKTASRGPTEFRPGCSRCGPPRFCTVWTPWSPDRASRAC